MVYFTNQSFLGVNLSTHLGWNVLGCFQSGTFNAPATLEQNEPNPFTESTEIRYYLPEGTKNSKITVKNTDGKVVGEYQNLTSGNGSISIEPGKLAANTYYYNLIIDGIEVETKKMILMR
jgi:hypothetical protein